jgi:single-strand DNA-binding protein
MVIFMNKVQLMGRLTRNPESKYVGASGDTLLVKYTLAVDRRYRGSNSTTSDFINCVVYGKGAEFAMKWLKKGMKIAVCGRIQTGSYTGKDDKKVYTTDVVVDEHYFAESKSAETTTDEEGFMEVQDGEELLFE